MIAKNPFLPVKTSNEYYTGQHYLDANEYDNFSIKAFLGKVMRKKVELVNVQDLTKKEKRRVKADIRRVEKGKEPKFHSKKELAVFVEPKKLLQIEEPKYAVDPIKPKPEIKISNLIPESLKDLEIIQEIASTQEAELNLKEAELNLEEGEEKVKNEKAKGEVLEKQAMMMGTGKVVGYVLIAVAVIWGARQVIKKSTKNTAGFKPL